MTAPTPPYAATTDVVFAVRQMVSPGVALPDDFSDETRPLWEEAERTIEHISSKIDVAFMQAGYVLPFETWEDEEWPECQTSFLRYLTVMGAAAHLAIAMLPAPAVETTTGYAQDNLYSKVLDEELGRIRDGEVAWRADCYIGTRAWWLLNPPRGPMTDFTEGIIDGMAHLELRQMTILRSSVDQTWLIWGGASSVEGYDWDTVRAWGRR